MTIYRLSERCAVAGQIQPADVETLATEGFKTIICNRPDNEDFGQPTADQIAAACEPHGIAFHLIPVGHGGLSMDTVAKFRDVVSASEGLVLAYCRSGQRSSIIWQASGAP
jgi:sulfide:quinone oxidoreductase